jgi:23S rRNA (pseudouridine1915-N3)-methyltransferase
MQSFPKLKLITVGKVKKPWIRDGLKVYGDRLPELEIVEIKDSNPVKEGELVLSMVGGRDRLIALSEEGKTYNSIEFARFLGQAASHQLILFIGSASGLSPQVKQQAQGLLSLSPMTFPHEIARLLLVEQLYRAKTILQNGSYHK